MLCDVFISKTTDIQVPNVTADYFIIEIFMLNVRSVIFFRWKIEKFLIFNFKVNEQYRTKY